MNDRERDLLLISISERIGYIEKDLAMLDYIMKECLTVIRGNIKTCSTDTSQLELNLETNND